MTQAPHGSSPGSGLTGIEPAPRRGRWLWVLPTLTFVAGLLLGGIVIGLSAGEAPRSPDSPLDTPVGDGPDAAPEPSASPSDLLVRVPEPCLAVAAEAEQAFTVFDSAVDAARSFDARRLQQVLDDVQELRPRVEQLADRCRDRAGQDVLDGTTATSVPTPTTGPTPAPGPIPTTGPTPTTEP